MFMVQPSIFRLHDRVSVMASAMTSERDTRTVKQVTIPVHGATGNPMASTTQPTPGVGATRNDTPRCPLLHGAPKRAVVGVQPTPGLGRCVQQRRACATRCSAA